MAEHIMSDAQERRDLLEELVHFNCRVAHPDDVPLFTREPKSSMQAVHWKAADLARMLEKLGASLKLEAGGQRRTLRLTNPGLPYGTTPTFWASIQYILPGEVATAHRHAAVALRFIMEGNGADTGVDGQQYEMNEGDLVLTPSWTWHDHEHKGDKPMVWLDVLDISLVRSLHATFFEAAEQPRHQVGALPDKSYREFGSGIMRPFRDSYQSEVNPLLVYHRSRTEEAIAQASQLPPDRFDDIALEYQNPLNGGPALPTIGTVLQMLRPGAVCQAHRRTGSAVYYVIRGEGRTVVDQQVFDWAEGDFFAIPPWATRQHSNRSADKECLLFQVNDIPVLKKLGLYREEAA